MLFPMGRSVYNGLDVKLTSNVDHLTKWIKHANYQVAYSLSRFVSQAQDQDFINYALNFQNPNQFSGPNGLDRRNQLSAGAWFDLPLLTRLSFTTHWYSSLPRTLLLPGGSIFTSDLNGDGTGAGNTTGANGDLLPGTNIGSFSRDFSVGGLNCADQQLQQQHCRENDHSGGPGLGLSRYVHPGSVDSLGCNAATHRRSAPG